MQGVSLPKIGINDFLSLKIRLPLISKLQKIVAKIEAIEIKIATLEQEMASVKSEKEAVLEKHL